MIERIARVIAAVAFEPERPLRQVDLVDVIVHDFGVEPLGVLAHSLHEPGAGEAVRIARPVVDLDGGHELTAFLDSREQHRLAIGARGVDGGGVTGGTGAQDQEPAVTGSAHVWILPRE